MGKEGGGESQEVEMQHLLWQSVLQIHIHPSPPPAVFFMGSCSPNNSLCVREGSFHLEHKVTVLCELCTLKNKMLGWLAREPGLSNFSHTTCFSRQTNNMCS